MSEEHYIEEPFRSRVDGTIRSRRIKIIRCCGRDMTLRNFTNTCDVCDADYNSSGARLAPREQWGEETGEHWTDCY